MATKLKKTTSSTQEINNIKKTKPDDELQVDEVMDDEEEVALTYDIASYPSDLTLSVLHEMWRNGDIVIPEFQRNFVWNIRQSSLLIDSFLLGLPVPQVFFYVDEENKSIVIPTTSRLHGRPLAIQSR